MSTGTDTKVKDALDRVRASMQELHAAISDAAAKQGAATKADLEAFAQKAKTAAEFVKRSMDAQNETAKKHLKEAVTHLEAAQKHVNEGLKSTGQAMQTSIRKRPPKRGPRWKRSAKPLPQKARLNPRRKPSSSIEPSAHPDSARSGCANALATIKSNTCNLGTTRSYERC